MKRSHYILKMSVCVLAAGSLLGACGKKRSSSSSSSTIELTGGIASLPSMSGMLAANSSASAIQAYLAHNRSVSGTAPLLKDLSASNVDTYFFNGSLANLASWASNSSSLTTAQKLQTARDYTGQDGYAGGQGACRMAQETGGVFDRMLSNGTSACYMRKMPGATGAAADTFAQGTDDKLVRVHVSNMPSHGEDSGPSEMYVNIKVIGTSNYTDGYKAVLYFCPATSGSPSADQGYEVIEFNKTLGQFTDSNFGSNQNSVAQAFLTKVGSQIAIDVSKDRSAIFRNSYNGMNYKSQVLLTGANKVYNTSYSSGTWGNSRNYSVASFTGASMADLRFTAGAFKGLGTSTGCTYWNGTANVACPAWSYSGGTEFQDTKYVSTTNSALYTELASVDLSTDDFFSDLTIPTADLSQFDCGTTPTSTVEMDFSTSGVQAAAAECEGERLFDSQDAWQMCEGGREHENLIWQNINQN